MSLKIVFNAPTTVIKQPEIVETITEVTIDRVVDIPGQKKVVVFIYNKRIELEALSGDNYDTPDEWTNADIIAAVKTLYGVV